MTNLNIMINNGKYSIDGYDWFDSLAELENEIKMQGLWAEGKARKDENGNWVEVTPDPEPTESYADRICMMMGYDCLPDTDCPLKGVCDNEEAREELARHLVKTGKFRL